MVVSIQFLIENEQSEPPRRGKLRMFLNRSFNSVSYRKWTFWASTRGKLRIDNFQSSSLLKMTIPMFLFARSREPPNKNIWARIGVGSMFLNGRFSMVDVKCSYMVNFQSSFLLKMTILSLHEAQAPNGQFSSNFLIENYHSEPPRGAGSKLSIFN